MVKERTPWWCLHKHPLYSYIHTHTHTPRHKRIVDDDIHTCTYMYSSAKHTDLYPSDPSLLQVLYAQVKTLLCHMRTHTHTHTHTHWSRSSDSWRCWHTQSFQMTVWLTVGGELSVVPSVVTGPCSLSLSLYLSLSPSLSISLFLSQTMTSSLVTQVLLLCNACSLLAAALSKQNWKLFLEELDTVLVFPSFPSGLYFISTNQRKSVKCQLDQNGNKTKKKKDFWLTAHLSSYDTKCSS